MYRWCKWIIVYIPFWVGLIIQPCLGKQVPTYTSSDTSHLQGLLSTLSHGKIDLLVGAFNASQGQPQDIAINGLIGDHFSVTSSSDQNAVLGIGYLVDGLDKNKVHLKYGINAFYFMNTTVKGNVIQEMQFENLSYRYDVTNLPIYFVLKSILNTKSDKYDLTMDVGIGPNMIKTSNFSESSLDGGITQPDNIFSGNTNFVFSGMIGVGVKFNNIQIYPHMPLECGYRFFYLGQGNFNKLSDQVGTTLTTGNVYANALVCSVSV